MGRREQLQAELQRRTELRSELQTRQSQQQVPAQVQQTAQPTQENSILPDFLTGADRETRATRELPELGRGGLLSGEDVSKVSLLAPVLLTTTKPREIGKILSDNFDNIRIQEDEKGNLIAGNNATGQRVVINKPGVSQLDILQGLGITAAFFPSAKLAGAASGIAKKVATGAAGAGATEAVIQGAQEVAGGDFDPEDVAIASALGGASEAVLPLIQKARQGFRDKRAGIAGDNVSQVKQTVKEAETAQAGVKQATGVDVPLFQGQQTVLPTTLERQSFVTQLPAGTQKAVKELKKQNKAVSSAVDSFLETIAPATSVSTGPAKFRSAANAALQRAKSIRSEKASPLYNRAFSENAQVDVKPVKDLIKTKVADFPPTSGISRTLRNTNKLLAGTQGAAPSLKQLHGAKLEIDDMLNSFGSDSIGNTAKKELREVRDLLVNQIDDASPAYMAAREEFKKASPIVKDLEDSIVGNVANMSDIQLKDISKRVFNPAETNPVVIRLAKKAINDIDPDAWNQLLRSEMERRLGSVKADLTGSTIENIPVKLRNAIFGNSKQKQVLFNAVDGETAKNLKYLETVLSRASLGRTSGSQTAAREEIKSELKGGVLQSIRGFISRPTTSISGIGEDALFNSKVKTLANVLFDPQWKLEMAKIRRLNPNSPAATRAMTQLLNDAQGDDNE